MSNAAQKRRYYRDDPDKHRARSRRYYHENAEAQRAKKVAWNASNPDIALARCQAFRAANPNYFRDYGARRRLGAAWRTWSTTLAASRRRMEQFA